MEEFFQQFGTIIMIVVLVILSISGTIFVDKLLGKRVKEKDAREMREKIDDLKNKIIYKVENNLDKHDEINDKNETIKDLTENINEEVEKISEENNFRTVKIDESEEEMRSKIESKGFTKEGE